MKISFDFDDCLDDNLHIQSLAKILVNAGVDVFILTAREKTYIRNDDLFKLADKIGIKRENIIFACMTDKHLLMQSHDIELHFDDNADTVDRINRYFDSPLSLNKRALLVNLDLSDIVNTWQNLLD